MQRSMYDRNWFPLSSTRLKHSHAPPKPNHWNSARNTLQHGHMSDVFSTSKAENSRKPWITPWTFWHPKSEASKPLSNPRFLQQNRSNNKVKHFFPYTKSLAQEVIGGRKGRSLGAENTDVSEIQEAKTSPKPKNKKNRNPCFLSTPKPPTKKKEKKLSMDSKTHPSRFATTTTPRPISHLFRRNLASTSS